MSSKVTTSTPSKAPVAAPAQNGVTDAAAAGAKKPRMERKSSARGDLVFALFLAAFGGLMTLSFQKKIPYQSWEILTLEEHLAWAQWMIDFWWLPVFLSVAYLVLTFGTQAFLANRAGWDKELRLPLAFWSFLLAAFSVAGALRTVPMAIEIVQKRGVMHLVCGDTRHEWLTSTPAGFWTLWFCLSKLPELIDTAFIVLRKKKLITLHWYHHFTVMLFCWQAWASCTLNGLIFAAMNLTVHAVMYTFYMFAALNLRPSTFDKFITMGQIAQMVVGTAVTAYVTLDKILWHPIKEVDFTLAIPHWFTAKNPQPDGGECFVSSGNALAGLIMYGSYLLFFVHFFINTYCRSRGSKGAKAE